MAAERPKVAHIRTEPDVVPRVAGTIVVFHRQQLEADLGKDLVDAALQQLDADERREVLDALPVSWVSHTALEAMYRECAKLAGRDLATLHTEIVRKGIEYRVRHVWRILIRLSSEEALAARAKMIFEKSYSMGRMRIEWTGMGHTVLVVEAWPQMSEMVVRGIRVGTETLLALANIKNVAVVSESRPDGAVFNVTRVK